LLTKLSKAVSKAAVQVLKFKSSSTAFKGNLEKLKTYCEDSLAIAQRHCEDTHLNEIQEEAVLFYRAQLKKCIVILTDFLKFTEAESIWEKFNQNIILKNANQLLEENFIEIRKAFYWFSLQMKGASAQSLSNDRVLALEQVSQEQQAFDEAMASLEQIIKSEEDHRVNETKN